MSLKNIEEVILHLSLAKEIRHVVTQWDKKFLENVSNAIYMGKPLTTKQAQAALSIMRRYENRFISPINDEIKSLLQYPIYKNPLVESKLVKKEVRYFEDSFILFRFPYDDNLTSELREISKNAYVPIKYISIGSNKIWQVYLNEENVDKITEFISNNDFDFDEETLKLIYNISNGKKLTSNVKIHDDTFEITINNNNLTSIFLTEMKWIDDV